MSERPPRSYEGHPVEIPEGLEGMVPNIPLELASLEKVVDFVGKSNKAMLMKPGTDLKRLEFILMQTAEASTRVHTEFGKILGYLNARLTGSLYYTEGLNREYRERAFRTLQDPTTSNASGLTPIDTGCPKGAMIRKYSQTPTFSTTADTNLTIFMLPSIHERNGDNGAFLYIKGFRKTRVGKVLVEDGTTTVIPTSEASWAHFSSGFVIRNVSATNTTVGTYSAAAIAPSTSELTNLDGDSISIVAGTLTRGGHVRAESQTKAIHMRNDCDVEYMRVRSRSSLTIAPYFQQLSSIQDLLVTNDSSRVATNYRLAPMTYFNLFGTAAQNVSPYFNSKTPDVTSVSYVQLAYAGVGYVDTLVPLRFTDPESPYGRTAEGFAIITSGAVSAVTITDRGNGYTSAPTITLDGDSTTPAHLKAHLVAGADGIAGMAQSNMETSYGPAHTSANANASIVKSEAYKSFPVPPTQIPNATIGAKNVIKIAEISPVSLSDAPLICGVRFNISGSIRRVFVDDGSDASAAEGAAAIGVSGGGSAPEVMTYALIWMIAESDCGVSYAYPVSTLAGQGQVGIPTPWSHPASAGPRTPPDLPAGFPPLSDDSGTIPPYFSMVELTEGEVTSFDTQLTVDNTLGADGSGRWPVASAPSNGDVGSGGPHRQTMADAIESENGRDVWSRQNTEFTDYKPFNIERARVYMMIITSNISNGDPATDAFDVTNLTVRLSQLRLAEDETRIATVVATSGGLQEYGVKTDINTCTIPKDDEKQRQPTADRFVLVGDLCTNLKSDSNAVMGEVVQKTSR